LELLGIGNASNVMPAGITKLMMFSCPELCCRTGEVMAILEAGSCTTGAVIAILELGLLLPLM
jgi:hypothetical protein